MYERYGAKLVRYADDFVILCKNPLNHSQILQEVTSLLESYELKLHSQKRCDAKTGKRFPLIIPSTKAEASFKAKIKNLTKFLLVENYNISRIIEELLLLFSELNLKSIGFGGNLEVVRSIKINDEIF